MGFNSTRNGGSKSNSPAKVEHKWKGGKGELTHWNGESEEATSLPATFAILEQTRCIRGFAPMGNTSIRYFSNETVAYDSILNVKSAQGDKSKGEKVQIKDVISGKYSEIKDKLPQGARLACKLFVYNKDTQQTEAIVLQGSSLGAFIEFSQGKNIYNNWVHISKGEEKINGSVKFFPPKYELGAAYTDDEIEKLTQVDQEVVSYQQSILNGGNTGGDSIDQTPAVYEGEFSQETAKPEPAAEKNEDGGVDFNTIPF